MAVFVPSRPESTEYAPFYENYIALVTEEDIHSALADQLEDVLSLLRDLPESVGDTRHPPYTWSVRQVIGHITDGERVFGHRAFRFSRNDPTQLPSFDENHYVSNGQFDACRLADLVEEFAHVRRGNLAFLRQLPAEAWLRRGVASEKTVSVRALAYVLLGHARHHLNILRKRLGAG
jgi:hypothetical protein